MPLSASAFCNLKDFWKVLENKKQKPNFFKCETEEQEDEHDSAYPDTQISFQIARKLTSFGGIVKKVVPIHHIVGVAIMIPCVATPTLHKESG